MQSGQRPRSYLIDMVLSGVTSSAQVARLAYQPTHVVESVADLPVGWRGG